MSPPLPPAASPEHLTEVLRRSGALGSGSVTAVAIDRTFPTIVSLVQRLRLAYDGASPDAPASIIFKTDLPNRPGASWESGRKEVAFYTNVAPATPDGLLLRCFEAHHDTMTGAWHLLLEDLTDSHTITTQWPLPPTIAQSEAIVRTHASFQAAWWDDPRLGVTVGAWPEPKAVEDWLKNLTASYAKFADLLGDRLSAERRAFYERLFEQAPLHRYRSRRNVTLVRGDSHTWNCFLPRDGVADTVRLFDWDGWRPTIGAEDLAYMMAMHWYPDLRRRAESHLLDGYHQELIERGVTGYDRSSLQDDYRLSVLWATTRPIWMQSAGIPPVIWWNHLERIHLAAADLDCRELLSA